MCARLAWLLVAVALVVSGQAEAAEPLTIRPEEGATVATHARPDFAAAGGSGAGFRWTLEPGPSGATIDPVTGVYVAGASPDVVDVVVVRDDLSNAASTRVAVVRRSNLAGGGQADNSWQCSAVVPGRGGAGVVVACALLLLAAFVARRRRID